MARAIARPREHRVDAYLAAEQVTKLRRLACGMSRSAMSRRLRVSELRLAELLQDGGPALAPTIVRIAQDIDLLEGGIDTEPRS